jgi:hypothetical protein
MFVGLISLKNFGIVYEKNLSSIFVPVTGEITRLLIFVTIVCGFVKQLKLTNVKITMHDL